MGAHHKNHKAQITIRVQLAVAVRVAFNFGVQKRVTAQIPMISQTVKMTHLTHNHHHHRLQNK